MLVCADPQLRKQPVEPQIRKERSETNLAEVAQKLHDVSLCRAVLEAAQQPASAAEPSRAPGLPAVPGSTRAAVLAAQRPAQNLAAGPAQQPNHNPFSSAFAYTERMNSAFSSN